jgi:hypothetical protein
MPINMSLVRHMTDNTQLAGLFQHLRLLSLPLWVKVLLAFVFLGILGFSIQFLADFLWNASEKLYFSQDSMFFVRSLLSEFPLCFQHIKQSQ